MSTIHVQRTPKNALFAMPEDWNDAVFYRLSQIVRGLKYMPNLLAIEVPVTYWRELQLILADVYPGGMLCPSCIAGVDCPAWVDLLRRRYADAIDEFNYQQRLVRADRALPPRYAWNYSPRTSGPKASPPPRPPPARKSRENDLSDAARVLGLTAPWTKTDVVQAFRKAALESHPDVGGSNEKMRAVLKARETLLG